VRHPYHFSKYSRVLQTEIRRQIDDLDACCRSSGVCAMATPCGVAKKHDIAFSQLGLFRREKAKLTRPRNDGNISATGMPSSLRDVIAVSSTCWMRAKMTQQFDAGITGAADNAYFDHDLSWLDVACHCILTVGATHFLPYSLSPTEMKKAARRKPGGF
jgi:hypothetical protein